MESTTSNQKPALLLQSSPHIASPVNSKALMAMMLIALAPVSIFGVVNFGLHALLNIIVAIVSAIAGESLFRLIIKQPVRAKDLSAGISGLLLALVIPPSTPLWMTALGSVFAVIVAKEFFGGLGANVFNPALAGRAFLVMSFPAALTTWKLPASAIHQMDAVTGINALTGATPLGIISAEGNAAVTELEKVHTILAEMGLSTSDSYWSTIKMLFWGFHGGSAGETSIFLILASCFFLLITRTIDWRAPLAMVGASFICALGIWQDPGFALFSILSGGLIFGAVFMATDYVTAPVTGKGKIIFGIGAGVITMLIRRWGTYPEGVCFSILIMNAVTPFLNKLLPRKYGALKAASKK